MSGPDLLGFGLNLLLGAGLGVFGGLLGIGGGLVAIPVLSFMYGMDQHTAQGTALIMIAPNVLIGFLRYRQRNPIDLRLTGLLCLLAMPITALSAHGATHIAADTLRLTFAMLLIALVLYAVWRMRRPRRADAKAAWPMRYFPAIGVLSGFMSGLFTVGGGLVTVPAMTDLFGMKQTQAQGIAMALVVPGALVALVSYAHAGYVNWPVGLALSLGGIVSVSWGVALAHALPAGVLRLIFCAVLFGTALLMLLKI